MSCDDKPTVLVPIVVGTTALHTSKRMRCPKHGEIGANQSVFCVVYDSGSHLIIRPRETHHYCMACYVEMISANCCRLEEVGK